MEPSDRQFFFWRPRIFGGPTANFFFGGRQFLEMSVLANRVFFWQAAFKFGRPPIFLADGRLEPSDRQFFFGGRDFFGGRPRFFFWRPRIFKNERFGKPRFFLAGRQIYTQTAFLLTVRWAGNDAPALSSNDARPRVPRCPTPANAHIAYIHWEFG